MNILIIRPTPNKLNNNTYNLQEIGLAKALVRKGHSCDVMYYCGSEKDHVETIIFDGDKKVNILWLHGYRIFREGIYPSLKKHVSRYDIIQVGGYVGFTSSWLNIKHQKKVINYQGPYYCEDNKGDRIRAFILDKILLPFQKKKNMIVATKSVLATEYIKSKGIKQVETIGVGLDIDNLNKGCDDAEKHEVINILEQGTGKYLLYIGVLEPRRNILFLLEVFKKISNVILDCKLVLIGKGDPEYVKKCFKYIENEELADRIIYLEMLEQKYVKEVYKRCDVFLLPTKYEIFGMVLLEAMYYSLPVFTTYNGGSSTLMNLNNGIVIEEFNVDIWVNEIIRVLSDDSLRKKIGSYAHNTIISEYTWDALAEKFLEVYRKRV